MFFSSVPKPAVPNYVFHQFLWTYYSDDSLRPGDGRPFVYRIASDKLLMLSKIMPTCQHHRVDVVTGYTYQFDLICSPVRSSCAGGKYPDGKRKSRNPYTTNEERREWLKRRLDGAAKVLFCTVTDRPDLQLKKANQEKVRWPECQIQGTLQVTDRTNFLLLLPNGVGGRGAWGHGMLHMPEIMK